MPNIQIVKPEDVDELSAKRDFSSKMNESTRKLIIEEISRWDAVRDNFKFQFFFNLIVNSYYTKDLLDAINKGYKDNTDTAFKFHKENGFL